MAAIDIRTTQNVTIEYELSSLRERFFAFFIDLLVYYALYIFLSIIIVQLFGQFMTSWGIRFVMLLHIAGLLIYHFLSDILFDGQSVGKKALKIKTIRLDGRHPGLGDYLIRSLFLLMDFWLSLGVLAAVLIGSTFRSQRLGDLAANTTVIRTQSKLHFHLSDILNIQSIDNYEPKYPSVRQLSESNMLLIKGLLSRYQNWQNPAHANAIHDAVQVVCQQLDIEPPKRNKIDFLKTLIRDYIVLTR